MTKDRLTLLREELNRHILQDLAEEYDLSYGCLWHIREGKTKWPRLKTLNVLLLKLGLEIRLAYQEGEPK